jgi:hypothetical protein
MLVEYPVNRLMEVFKASRALPALRVFACRVHPRLPRALTGYGLLKMIDPGNSDNGPGADSGTVARWYSIFSLNVPFGTSVTFRYASVAEAECPANLLRKARLHTPSFSGER